MSSERVMQEICTVTALGENALTSISQKEEQMFDIFLCIWYTIFMKKEVICL